MTDVQQLAGSAPALGGAGQLQSSRPSVRVLAFRDALSVMSGIAAFGLTLGVTISSAGSDRVAGLIGTVIVFGGSAQLTAVTLLSKGIALPAAVVTAAVVNLRLVLYSAALGDRFRQQPRWFRLFAPQFIIDQTYVLATSRAGLAGAEFRRYWWWMGGAVLLCWSGSVAAGLALAPAMPDLPHLGLVATALFLGLLVGRLTSTPAVVAAVVGGTVAAAVSVVLPAVGIVAGAIAGVAAAMAVSRRG
jgi:predicted branched-subunit amino acid permease